MDQAYWLRRAARLFPDSPALLSGKRTIATFAQWLQRSSALAAHLKHAGLRAGDRVAIVADNAPAYLEALYAIWHAGMIAVPVNAKLHGSEVAWIFADCDVRFAFLDAPRHAASYGPSGDAMLGALAFGTKDYERAATREATDPTDNAADNVAWIFYTSGTTGRPKGAMLTHRNLAAMSWAYLTEVDVTQPGDVLLHAAPMSHGSGLYALPHVARGGINVVPESGHFDAAEIAHLSGRLDRISMFAAPTMIRRLVETDADIHTENLRTLVWGGAPMHVADTVRALDRLGPCLAQIYGQGESPMTISSLSKTDVGDRNAPGWLEGLESAGWPSAMVEVRIDGDDAAGEILVRGDTVMAGYWNRPEATAETLAGGWLHTGDVGAFDASGRLVLKDRSKDVIISGGSNIYPREVEEVLLKHPRVKEAAVIGRPDAEWGEVVVAFVVGDAPQQELDNLCLGHLARFKRPRHYSFPDSLPKNGYGKIEKAKLRSMP